MNYLPPIPISMKLSNTIILYSVVHFEVSFSTNVRLNKVQYALALSNLIDTQ